MPLGQMELLGVIPIFSKYSWRDIIASIVTLESVIGRPIGSAGPLWSLGYEWAFYIAFPLIVLCADWAAKLLGLRPLWTRAAAILLSVVGLVAIHKFFAAAFWLIWIAGALAHVVTKQNLTPIQLHWAGAACALIGLACAPLIDSRVYDPIIGFGFAFFLSAYPSNEKAIFGSIDKKLADFSYSFYAIHLPILTLCLLLLWRWNVVPVGGLPADFHAYGILIAVMMIAILTAFAFGRLFESRTDAFRKILLGARGKQGKA